MSAWQGPEVDQLTLDGSPFAPYLVTLQNATEIGQYRRMLKAKYNKMLPLCNEERKIGQKYGRSGANPELEKLRTCLNHFGTGECPYGASELRAVAQLLPGFRMLERAIDGCTTVTSKGSCGRLKGTPETNAEGAAPPGSIFPDGELKTRR